MNKKLKKTGISLAMFALIVAFVLWLIPAGLAYGEDTSPQSIEVLQQAVDDATAALADARLAATEADAVLTAAEQALADAQAALDNAAEGDDLTVLQQAVDNATAALADARLAATEADAVLAAAEQALVDAQAALDSALNENGQDEPLLEGPLLEDPGIPQDEPVVTSNPVLTTDKADYSPEETVIITGTGFLPDTAYIIVVTRPDNSIVKGDGSFTPGSDSVSSDASGNFTYAYILDGITGTYRIDAVDSNGITVSSTTFSDNYWYSVSVCKTGLEWGYWWADQATFTLTGPNGYNSSQTVSNWFGIPSTITWYWLSAGTYTLQESYPGTNNFNYTSNITFPQIFNLPAGSWPNVNKHFDVINAKVTTCPGSVLVTKIVLDPDGIPVNDTTTFHVALQQSGVTKYETDFSSGSPVLIPDITPGTYDVVETDASGNYILNTLNVSTIDVGSGETNVDLTITNQQDPGSITINKTDAVTGLPLEGSTFELWQYPGPVLIDTVVLGSGTGGTHTWPDLSWGHYVVIETIAPAGYELAPPMDVF